jgi:hypothetical protein
LTYGAYIVSILFDIIITVYYYRMFELVITIMSRNRHTHIHTPADDLDSSHTIGTFTSLFPQTTPEVATSKSKMTTTMEDMVVRSADWNSIALREISPQFFEESW